MNIYMDEFKKLTLKQKEERIFKGENKATQLKLILPKKVVNNLYSTTDCTFKLKAVTSNNDRVEQTLTITNYDFDENYEYCGTYDLPSTLTQEPQKIDIYIEISKINDSTVLGKTTNVTLIVEDTPWERLEEPTLTELNTQLENTLMGEEL